MASVPSIDRQKASTVFRSIEQTHVQEVLPVVEDRLRDVLGPDESLPDVSLFAALLGRIQVDGTRRLTAADSDHEEELANDTEPRERRDETGERVHRKLVEVRRIADGLFGPERSGELLGTGGPAAPVAEGERLWRQGEDTAKRLEVPEFTAPVMTTASLLFDPPQLVEELRTDLDAFREALDAVALEQRKAEATLEVKNARLDDSKRIDAACASFIEGFFLLADRGDLLEKFRRARGRTTPRRASGTGEEPPAPDVNPPPDGEPSQEPLATVPPAGEPFAAASSAD